MPDQFPCDVFLSHGAMDKAGMRPLAERWRSDGPNPKAEGRRKKEELRLHPSASVYPARVQVGLGALGLSRCSIIAKAESRHLPVFAETGGGETIASPALAG